MGRIVYLTRIALGRSALQLPQDQEDGNLKGEDDTRAAEASTEHGEQTDEANTSTQLYDSKGYPINPDSSAFKRSIAHAQNDVLETIGICAKEDKALQAAQSDERTKRDVESSENDLGLYISAGDALSLLLSNACFVGLRQRIQTFDFLVDMPLMAVIRSEARTMGLVNATFKSVPSCLFYFGFSFVREEVLWTVRKYRSFEIRDLWTVPDRKKRPLNRLHPAMIGLNVISFWLLAPLKVYSILQRLGIERSWAPLPSPMRYKELLFQLNPFHSLLSRRPDNGYVSFIFSACFASPFAYLLATEFAKIAVSEKVIKYVRAALPRPTQGSKNWGNNMRRHARSRGCSIALREVDDLEDAQFSEVMEMFASDLRSIGRNWQRMRSRVSGLFSTSRQTVSTSIQTANNGLAAAAVAGLAERTRQRRVTASSVGSLPDSLRQAMQSRGLITPDLAQATIASRNIDEDEPVMHTEQIDQVNHAESNEPLGPTVEQNEDRSPGFIEAAAIANRIFPESLLAGRPQQSEQVNHTEPSEPPGPTVDQDEPPSPVTEATTPELPEQLIPSAPNQHDDSPAPLPQTRSRTSSWALSSPLSGRSTPPPPIEITTSTAPTGTLHMNVTIPEDIRDHRERAGRTFAPPSPSSSSNTSHNSDDNDNDSGASSEPSSPATTSSSDSENDMRNTGPPHRVTLLTEHASRSMALHISAHLAELLFLPLEALVVRSVAGTFWPSPGLAMRYPTRGAAGRWVDDILPPYSWFGRGLVGAGGWESMMRYASKLFLCWGMEVGVGMAVWEVSTGVMWWVGLEYFSWCDL